jgi:biotin operon repressor
MKDFEIKMLKPPKGKPYTTIIHKGKRYTLSDLSKKTGLSREAMLYRVKTRPTFKQVKAEKNKNADRPSREVRTVIMRNVFRHKAFTVTDVAKLLKLTKITVIMHVLRPINSELYCDHKGDIMASNFAFKAETLAKLAGFDGHIFKCYKLTNYGAGREPIFHEMESGKEMRMAELQNYTSAARATIFKYYQDAKTFEQLAVTIMRSQRVNPLDGKHRIMKYLSLARNKGVVFTINKLSHEMPMSSSTIRRHVNELIKQGDIIEVASDNRALNFRLPSLSKQERNWLSTPLVR